jgi:ABC-type branched-subunit amino acid transport system ATPase component
MLEIQNINAGYGRLHVLFDINAKMKEKDITGIVGPNGSGKSTLLKTVMGITQVYSGKILFNGTNIVGLPPHVVTKLGIAYLPQVNNVFANLTVNENLLMAGYVLGKEEAKEIMLRCWKRGVAIITSGASTLRVAPPLNITTELVDAGLDIVEDVIREVEKEK